MVTRRVQVTRLTRLLIYRLVVGQLALTSRGIFLLPSCNCRRLICVGLVITYLFIRSSACTALVLRYPRSIDLVGRREEVSGFRRRHTRSG